MADHDEMKNSMRRATNNRLYKANDTEIKDAAFKKVMDLLGKTYKAEHERDAYKAIADMIFKNGTTPCSHLKQDGLYRKNCDWCMVAKAYELLTNNN